MNVENKQYTGILAGFGKADVTPFAPVHLGSFNNGMQRLSEKIKKGDTFNALTLALTDSDGETVLLIVTDLSWGHIKWAVKIRQILLEKYGIAGNRVILGGTHNHSGPDWYSEASETPANRVYLEFWLKGVLDSVEMALKDRKPAQIQVGRTKTDKLTFVRRYWRADGNLIGDVDRCYPESDSPIVAHETEADEQVQMVRFLRQDAPDILVGQWQAHGVHIGGTKLCATDWIGPMRRKVEKELGCHYFYMQGAAGNMKTKTRIKAECPVKKTEDEVGEAVADTIVAAYRKEGTFRTVNGGKVDAIQQNFTANDVRGDEWTGEMNTISVGDVSVVTFPVEIFDTSGKQIKAQTPYEMTLIMGYSCGIHGYCPDKEAFAHGGYEATSRGVSGTAEKMVAVHLEALNRLHDK